MKKDTVLWARQYSKRLITFLLIAWVVGAVIGVAYEFTRLMTAPDMASMDALYIYLAVPLTCGIPSYLIPNIFLNKEKVRQNYIANYDNTVLYGEYGGSDTMIYNDKITEGPNDTGFYAYTTSYSSQSGNPYNSGVRYPSRSGGAYGNRVEGISDEDT